MVFDYNSINYYSKKLTFSHLEIPFKNKANAK